MWDQRELDQLDGRIREAVQRLASIPEIEGYQYTVQRKIPAENIASVCVACRASWAGKGPRRREQRVRRRGDAHLPLIVAGMVMNSRSVSGPPEFLRYAAPRTDGANGFRSSLITSSSSRMAASTAWQLNATLSPSSKISSVQPWQKTPPQARTHAVVERVLTPQVGQVIATVEDAPGTTAR